MSNLSYMKGVRELGVLKGSDIHEFLEDPFVVFSSDFEAYSGRFAKVSNLILDNFLYYVEDGIRDGSFVLRGSDFDLLMIAVEDIELFEFICNYEHTREFMKGFDFRIGETIDIREISIKVYNSVYYRTLDDLSYYFNRYVDLVGGLTDAELIEINDTVNDLILNCGNESDEYETLLSRFNLLV